MQYRQGDVCLVPCKKVEGKKVEPVNGRVILAEGEATGHFHAMSADTCAAYSVGKKMQLVVREETALTHDEHSTIQVSPDTYWVVRQREYSPKEIHRVID